jgi:hypothetical protein
MSCASGVLMKPRLAARSVRNSLEIESGAHRSDWPTMLNKRPKLQATEIASDGYCRLSMLQNDSSVPLKR